MAASHSPTDEFLTGGGEMGAIMRGRDWSDHPLGPPARWPAALRLVVRLMLNSFHPVIVYWAREHYFFYNDAFSLSLGPEKHPCGLGRPAIEVWQEIWPVIGPQLDQVLHGDGATWHENQLVPIIRNGALTDVYWTYSFSPIDDPTASFGVGGTIVICTETTETVLAERRAADEARAVKARIVETHHRVKNNMATISAMVNIEARRIEDPAQRAPFDRISARLQSFSKLYELMLDVDSDMAIDAGRYVTQLTETVGNVLGEPARQDIEIAVAADPVRMPANDAIHLGAIVVELVHNAFAHAFRDRAAGRLTISLRDAGETIVLTVADNGVGFDESRPKPRESTGIGMKLVHHYVDMLGGRMERASGSSGTVSTVTMPKRAPVDAA